MFWLRNFLPAIFFSERPQSSQEEVNSEAANLLPEVLESAFRHLGKRDKASCSQVCRSWYEASGVPSLWRHEEARLDLDRLSPDMVRSLEQRRVGRVVVTGGCSGKALRMLLEGHPSMEHLELTLRIPLHFCHLVEGFNKELPCLKTLKISYTKVCTLYTVLDSLFRCACHLENLTFFRIDGSDGNDLCARYGSRLRKLKRLTFQTGRLSDEGIRLLTGVISSGANISDVSAIEHLEFSNIDLLKYRFLEPMTDRALEHIAQGFPSLKSLRCESCVLLNGSGLAYLLQLPQLESLSFAYCKFSSCQVRQLGLCSASVKHLQLEMGHDFGWEQADFLNLPNCFPSLTHVDLLMAVVPGEVILSLYDNLRNLQKLKLSYATSNLQRALQWRCGGRVTFQGGTIIFQDRQLP